MSKQKQKEPLSLMIVKTILAIAVFTGLGTIIIGGGVMIMKYYNSGVKPVNQEIRNCIKEGEKFYLKQGESQEKECCNDLKTGAVYSIIENKCIPETVASICIDCPNNECGIGENKCNCPEDCENKDETVKVEVYFNNIKKYNELSKEIGGKEVYKIYGIDDCGPTFPVTRIIPKPKNEIELTQSLLEELKKGPTKEEQLQGFTSEDTFVKIIKDFEIKNEILFISFDEEKLKEWEKTISPRTIESLASCERSNYTHFIDITLRQSPDIEIVAIGANVIHYQPDTSDWQTYRNEEFGFEVKYPEDLILRENNLYRADNDKRLSHFNKGSKPQFIQINRFELKKSQTFKDVIIENSYLPPIGGPSKHPKFLDFEEKKIGNNSFYFKSACFDIGTNDKGEDLCESQSFYWLVGKNEIYEFNLLTNKILGSEGVWYSEDSALVEKILSTFKFTD